MRTEFSLLKASVFLSLLLLFSFFKRNCSYTFNGFEIRDLEFSSITSSFLQEADTFETLGLKGTSKVFTYSGFSSLGGYGILADVCGFYPPDTSSCIQWGNYFRKTYSDLPAHSYIYFTIEWWVFGSWNPSDIVEFQFDNTVIKSWPMNYVNFAGGTMCTSLQSSGALKIYGRIAHTDPTLTVTFRALLDQDSVNESFGIREIRLLFVQNPVISGNNYCAAPWTLPGLYSALRCPFSTQGYFGTTGSTFCDPSCSSCFGAGSNLCYSCNTGYFWDGDNCVVCHSSCSVCFGTGEDECNVCKTGYFRYPDNTCKASCASPLLQTPYDTTGIQLPTVQQKKCTLPCEPGEFLNWANACQATCDPPLQSGVQTTVLGDVLTCSFSCNTAPNTILYWDGSCQSLCNFPLISQTISGKITCTFSCNSAPYTILYWDGSCKSSCNFPLLSSKFGGKEFCKTPCTNQNDYLYHNGSCSSTCHEYFIVSSIFGQKLCGPACQDGYTLYQNDRCVPLPPPLSNTTKTVLKNSQITSSATVQVASAVNSGRAISISAAVGGRIFYNIKFLNISYSRELQQALKDWLPSFISLGLTPNLPESYVERVPDRSVPPTFEKYGVEASFFLNFWQNLGILLMIACACVLVKLFEFLTTLKLKQVKYIQAIIKKIKILMQNFLMMTLYGIYGDLVLFAILEYRTLQFKFDFSALSFGMAFILIIIMFVCLAFHYKLLNRYQKIKDQPDLLKAFDKDYEGVQAIYKDFEDKYLSRQGFLILLTLREIAFSIIISTLFAYPVIQAEIFLINSMFMMAYLIKENPFKSKFDYIQQVFFEAIGLVVNVGVFLICFQSGNNGVETKTVWTIGRMIIIMNLIFNFSSAGLMFVQILMIIKDHWEAYKEKKAKRIKVVNHHVEEEGGNEMNGIQGKSLTIQTELSMIGEPFRNEQSRFIRR